MSSQSESNELTLEHSNVNFDEIEARITNEEYEVVANGLQGKMDDNLYHRVLELLRPKRRYVRTEMLKDELWKWIENSESGVSRSAVYQYLYDEGVTNPSQYMSRLMAKDPTVRKVNGVFRYVGDA